MKRHGTGYALALLISLGPPLTGVPPASAAATTDHATTADATPDHTAARYATTDYATVTAEDYAAVSSDDKVVAALERGAHPLRTVEPGGDTGDLRALDPMIGDARVVGLGEATHSSHDFFALKDRVFRHLVEEKGFRTFALEAPGAPGCASTTTSCTARVTHGAS